MDFDRLFQYHEPTGDQVLAMDELRASAQKFAEDIWRLAPAGPDRTVAVRKVREALAVANAAVILDPSVHTHN